MSRQILTYSTTEVGKNVYGRNDQRSREKAILAESYYKQEDMVVNKIASEIECIKKCGNQIYVFK